MLKMKVISKVEIEPITEEFMGELIRNEISAQNPDVTVNGIEFKVSRNPTRVEAIVDAQYGDVANTETELDNSADETAVKLDDPVKTESVDETEATSVGDIFGG